MLHSAPHAAPSTRHPPAHCSPPPSAPAPPPSPALPLACLQGSEEDHEAVGEGESYQLEMMRCLREVNVDNNTVGWYQSTISGSFQVVEIIETFVSYMESLERCVCIVYDTTAAEGGALGLKAIRLSEAFVEAYREGE